jgi:hypothetical protein
MQKRPAKKKHSRDVNARAFAIGELATGNAKVAEEPPKADAGRKGGLKGGNARAKKLSAQRRAEIARAVSGREFPSGQSL